MLISITCASTPQEIFSVQLGQPQLTGYVYEFSHGKYDPTAILTDPGYGQGCSVDPVTGNLAVANYLAPGSGYDGGNIAIYTNATGAPITYQAPGIRWFKDAAYDSKGNLYADGNTGGSGSPLAVMRRDSHTFSSITTNAPLSGLAILWHKGHLIAEQSECECYGPALLYELKVAGSTATIVHRTKLRARNDKNGAGAQFWIQGDEVFNAGDHQRNLFIWRYPQGGRPLQVITKSEFIYGVTISAGPSSLGRRM